MGSAVGMKEKTITVITAVVLAMTEIIATTETTEATRTSGGIVTIDCIAIRATAKVQNGITVLPVQATVHAMRS